MSTLLDQPVTPPDHRGHSTPHSAGPVARFVRGRPDDAAWVRPALISMLVGTAGLYLWGLDSSGWANSFYSAAVQAGTKSWKAFFFGSFDSASFITVDKSPAALWVMELSARVFGVNSWSILVPEALEGVATVGLLYLTVRRWFSPAAALVAGTVAALTPVAVLMFRFNNPDALMVLLLTAAAYATVRAVEGGRTRWVVAAGALVGFGFLAKMLQALLVVPAFGLTYLVAAPGPIRRRVIQLLYGGVALVAAAGWWVLAVQLTPAADRPYIGGSQNNTLWNLIFGYNGFGRLTGNETGSVGGATGAGGNWGATGLTRLFGSQMGTQVSWLLPAALVLLVAGLYALRRTPRRNRGRAALLLWGGWLAVSGAAFSLGRGIIHPYYTVALAPAIGALIGVGGYLMWQNRHRWRSRAVMSAAVAATAVWSYVLLDRTPTWLPALRMLVLPLGLIAAAALLWWPRVRGQIRYAAAAAVVVAGLGGPAAYALDTANTPHSGAIPSAGPASATAFGGPGGPGRRAGGPPGGGFGPVGAGRPPGGGFVAAGGFGPRRLQTAPGANRGAAGGLLDASRPSAAITALLKTGSAQYTWVAATTGANSAAGYQLATGDPVMAIGGFNGTDPYPTLAQFEQLVKQGRVHYFIGGGAGPGGALGNGSTSSAISAWVTANFTAQTVGGVAVYDLSGANTA